MTNIPKRIANFCVVYYLSIFFFSIQVFVVSCENAFTKILDSIMAIIFLCIYPLFYFLSIWGCRKYKEQVKAKEYYQMQFPDIDALKKAGKHLIFSYVIPLLIMFLLIFIAFIIDNFDRIKEIPINFHDKIWYEQNMITIIGSVVAIYAFLLTFLSIIVSYLDNKCLFFRPFDLPLINISIVIMVISLLISMIYIFFSIYFKNHFILGVCEIIWFLLILIVMVIYMMAFLTQIEKRILRKIHNLYGRKQIYITPSKKWWKGSVIKQLSYFLKGYNKILNNNFFMSIQNVEFGCILLKKEENIKLAKKKIYLLAVRILVILFIYGFCLKISFSALQQKIYFMITLLSSMPLLIPLVERHIVVDNFAYINSLGALSEWGYYITLNNNRIKYVSTYDIFSNSKYKKYLVKIKQIACFYRLAINMEYEDEECIDELCISCLCDYVRDLEKQKKYHNGMLVPLLICACLSKNKNNEDIKKMLQKLKITDSEKFKSIKISIQILRDLWGDDLSYNELEYEVKLLGLFPKEKNYIEPQKNMI